MLDKKTLLAATLLLIAQLVFGEPTEKISWLMNEPLTLFEWGIFKLEQKLNKHVKHKEMPNLHFSVWYYWDRNRISIFGSSSHNEQKTEEEAKRLCKEIIYLVKHQFEINLQTGQPYEFFENSTLGVCFAHFGFKAVTRPEGIEKELDNITEIIAQVHTYPDGEDWKTIKCQAPLLGTQIMFVEE